MTSETIKLTKDFVQLKLQKAEAGHDWFHVERVWKNAKLILEKETADAHIVELAALLHDIADSKFHDGDEELGPQIARSFLQSIQVSEETITHVCKIIKNMSFKASLGKIDFWSKELEIVQDADRLDAIGAIGIARAFNYGGFKNRSLYDPSIKPKEHQSKEEYKQTTAPTINHFYEKLLLLKARMNTTTGKQLAEARHRYMEDFLVQFFDEWEGRK
ncbi:HD domain-containing protein [Olivibacter sp. XZL3]|uniref:HD domain-containing protein n=1 Tax=Olivibacter sp. XZL3 TaxID=1735116 RepID=UPI001065B75D|nr:HD domain-containing protein [Olivibacter sp. XZL3]